VQPQTPSGIDCVADIIARLHIRYPALIDGSDLAAIINDKNSSPALVRTLQQFSNPIARRFFRITGADPRTRMNDSEACLGISSGFSSVICALGTGTATVLCVRRTIHSGSPAGL
jgi:hypothetical protein